MKIEVARLEGVFSRLAEPTFTIEVEDLDLPHVLVAEFDQGGNQVIYDGTTFIYPYQKSKLTLEDDGDTRIYRVVRLGSWYGAVTISAIPAEEAFFDSLEPSTVLPLDVEATIECEIGIANPRVLLFADYTDGSKEMVFDSFKYTFFYRGAHEYEAATHNFSFNRVGGWQTQTVAFSAKSMVV